MTTPTEADRALRKLLFEFARHGDTVFADEEIARYRELIRAEQRQADARLMDYRAETAQTRTAKYMYQAAAGAIRAQGKEAK